MFQENHKKLKIKVDFPFVWNFAIVVDLLLIKFKQRFPSAISFLTLNWKRTSHKSILNVCNCGVTTLLGLAKEKLWPITRNFLEVLLLGFIWEEDFNYSCLLKSSLIFHHSEFWGCFEASASKLHKTLDILYNHDTF